jgi:hypothetical protein
MMGRTFLAILNVVLLSSVFIACSDTKSINSPNTTQSPVTDYSALPQDWKPKDVVDCSDIGLSYVPKPLVIPKQVDPLIPSRPTPSVHVHAFLEIKGHKINLIKASAQGIQIDRNFDQQDKKNAEDYVWVLRFSIPPDKEELEGTRCHELITVEFKDVERDDMFRRKR